MWALSSHYSSAGCYRRQPKCSSGSLGEWALFSKVTSYYIYLFMTPPSPLYLLLYCLDGAEIKEGTYAVCHSSCHYLSFYSQML